MKKKVFITVVFGFLLAGFFQQCKKPEKEWAFCEPCKLDAWTGSYTGKGSYYTAADLQIVDGLEVQLKIGNPSANQFTIELLSPDYYSQSFFSSKTDSNYYFNIASQTSSINLNLYQKENEYKITGVAKKGQLEWVDSVLVIIPDYSLTFEVFKIQ